VFLLPTQDKLFTVQNYFSYFTDIEEHFCRRRGAGLQLSPLDWALIETWKDAGIPLEAVLRGIDATFDHYDRRPPRGKTKKINGLAWCAQEVLSAAEEMKEAAVGATREEPRPLPGMGAREIAEFLGRNAGLLLKAGERNASAVRPVLEECSGALSEMARRLDSASQPPRLEDVERHLTVLEEKLLAALTVSTPEGVLLALRAEADREIAPYRSKMPGLQIEQLRKQFVHKRLFEQATIARLSLFYM
jgi:hypothetical protein